MTRDGMTRPGVRRRTRIPGGRSEQSLEALSRSSLRSAGGGIYESETMRLQKEVDRFTEKLELEKRKLFIIDE